MPNPSFEPKNSPVAPRGGGAKSGGALPKLRIWCPKRVFFGPKQPQNPVQTDKRREAVATLHVRLNCPVTRSPFLPSSSTICPRKGPKMAKNGLNVRCLCQIGPKPRTGQKQPFFAQNSPQTRAKRPTGRETVATLHVRLDITVSKSPPVPFNSTICPRNGPKRRQKAPKSAQCAPTPRNQERAASWATWLQIRFGGHLVRPQPPNFCGFRPLQIAQTDA